MSENAENGVESVVESVTVESGEVESVPVESGAVEKVDGEVEAEAVVSAPKKRKRKRNKKKKKKKIVQTDPPTVPISQLWLNRTFPEGEIMHYKDDNLWRESSEEKRELERLCSTAYEDSRWAAEVHRTVRQAAQKFIQPGMKMIDICNRIEEMNRNLVEADGIIRGIAFPTGCSINRCAAHYTPNTGDETVLGEDDIVKFDFGTHVNGRIIDCAWTMHWNPQFDPLSEACREATNTGLREAGIDVRLCDIGAAIREVMESYEVTIGQKVYPVKTIKNLNGHNIGPYSIHAGKSVPLYDNKDSTRMEEGEFFAIETFGSTGKGKIEHDMETSHYMKNLDVGFVPLRSSKAKQLLGYINNNYDTLAFCRKWLDQDGQTNHFGALRELTNAGIIDGHPPLCDVRGSYTAQFEHTFVLRPTCKEILSRGDDY